MTVVVGLDHGNGWIKAKTSEREIVLPAGIARVGAFGDDVMARGKMNVDEYESNLAKGEVYLWGEDILKAPSIISSYGSQDRYRQQPYRLLTDFALAAVIGEENSYDDVCVITGVPSQQKGTIEEEHLKDILKGGHIVKVNGQDKIIRVTEVVVLPQPVGTVMSQYLDKDGFVLDESFEEDSVAVVDLGTGTSDLDHIKELRRQEEDTLSIPIGMFDVYKKVAAWINKKNPNAQATPQKVEQQFENDSYAVSKRSVVDIAEVKAEALREVAMDVKNAVTQQWKTWDRFDKIILTGGGASTLGKSLKELLSDAEIVPNCQIANAEGFYRYGQFLKGE